MKKHPGSGTTNSIFRRLCALLCACLMLISCGGTGGTAGTSQSGNAGEGKLSVVVTIFPLYDWAGNILGEESGAELTFLLNSGVDMHSFQPTTSDIMKISSCDLFLYVGGESDAWVEKALAEAANPKLVAVNLLELLGERAREEELLEGMQEDEAHDHDHAEDEHDHEEDHDHAHGEESEYDEHIWLSLQNAAYLIPQIAETLSGIDPENGARYKENADAYVTKLNALDGEYAAVVAASPAKTLLFCDRFPFRYLAEDYGLTCYAAFSGCSAETEASFETIAFLSEKVKELSLAHVITIEGSETKIADTVLAGAGAAGSDILVLDSMQSTTAQDAEGGVSYLSVMEKNLEVLKEALQ